MPPFLGSSYAALLLTLLWRSIAPARGIVRPVDGNGQCVGSQIDYSRLETINVDFSDSDRQSLFPVENYLVEDISVLPSFGRLNSDGCVGRVRLQETLEGYPIYGANVITTFDGKCSQSLTLNATTNEEALEESLNDLSYTSMYGKTFTNVQVPSATFTATLMTEPEAMLLVATHFGVDVQDLDLQDITPSLQIFVSTDGDFLTYFVDELLVPLPNSTAGLYRVIVDTQSREVVSVCTYVDPTAGLPIERKRDLRVHQHNRRLQNTCATCATNYTIDSFGSEVSCPINSLYLDDTGKSTTCTQAIVPGIGFVDVPGSVSSLFWEGTYDCRNTRGPCFLSELPTSCADTLSDIQYTSLRTLQYLQSSLNVLGGLSSDASNPVSVIAFAHWRQSYCNAFFRGPNKLYFGDCDCSLLTELVSVDIVSISCEQSG